MNRPTPRLSAACRRALMSWRRWPVHRWWLIALLLPTVWIAADVLGDVSPFDGWVQYTTSTTFDRETLGYNVHPAYRDRPAEHGGGYFDPYDHYPGSRQHSTRDFFGGSFGYDRWELPHWPDGDPGLGANNPPPPQVVRHEIYAVTPGIPLAMLGIGWLIWGALFARHRLRDVADRRGFEVVAVARAAGREGRP
jgi:hypothetical protein